MENSSDYDISSFEPISESADFNNIEPPSSSAKPLAKKKKNVPGREKARITILLSEFKTRRGKAPKKEYLNAFIIRAIKKGFRKIHNNMIPKTSSLKINNLNSAHVSHWNNFIQLYRTNKEFIEDIMRTENGPQTDGKSKRDNIQNNNCARTFNNNFCKTFFSSAVTQKALKEIIGIIINSWDSAETCKRLKFNCCSGEHNSECREKWFKLKNYFESYYFEDLGVQIATGLDNLENEDMLF